MIAHVGSFEHFVFVYLHILYLCILRLIHGNVIFDTCIKCRIVSFVLK